MVINIKVKINNALMKTECHVVWSPLKVKQAEEYLRNSTYGTNRGGVGNFILFQALVVNSKRSDVVADLGILNRAAT